MYQLTREAWGAILDKANDLYQFQLDLYDESGKKENYESYWIAQTAINHYIDSLEKKSET